MTKRIISVLLALVLVLALAMPVLAEEAQTFILTIHDTETDRTYEAYQVFSGDLSVSGETANVLSNLKWGTGVTPDGEGKIAGKTATEWETELLADPSLAKSFADTIGKNLSNTKYDSKAGEGVYTFENLPAGYYFVKETTNVQNENDTVSAFILNIVTATDVTPKRSPVPTVEKDQSDIDATYELGEEITFTIKATLPSKQFSEYTTYYVELADEMSPELDYADSWKIMVGDKDITSYFTLSENGQKLNWVCGNVKAEGLNLQAGDVIVLTYKAVLNEDALKVDYATNEVKLIYSNNPETDGKGETPLDTEMLFTFTVNGDKVDMDNEETKLSGAEFILQKKGTETYYSWNDTTKKVEWVARENAEPKVSADDGSFAFEGLDEGEYTLIETKAPAGYNVANPIEIKIEAKKITDDEEVEFKFYVDGELAVTKKNDPEATITVENGKGTTLPETGGIGTTIFYLVGGLMMAAAVVLLVAKKRTVNE